MDKSTLRIVFMGTPDIARLALERIYESGNEILAVVTTPDTKKGRGMKLIPSPVKEYAIEKGFKIYQPEKIRKNEEFINEIKDLNLDLKYSPEVTIISISKSFCACVLSSV